MQIITINISAIFSIYLYDVNTWLFTSFEGNAGTHKIR